MGVCRNYDQSRNSGNFEWKFNLIMMILTPKSVQLSVNPTTANKERESTGLRYAAMKIRLNI